MQRQRVTKKEEMRNNAFGSEYVREVFLLNCI